MNKEEIEKFIKEHPHKTFKCQHCPVEFLFDIHEFPPKGTPIKHKCSSCGGITDFYFD